MDKENTDKSWEINTG